MPPLPRHHAPRPVPSAAPQRPVLPRPLVRAMVARERYRKQGRHEDAERLLRQMVAEMDAPTWELWWRWAAFWTEDGPDAQWRYNVRAMELMTGVLSAQPFHLKVSAPQVLEQSLRQLLAWGEEEDTRHPTNALWSLSWWLQHHRAPDHATRARGEGPGTTLEELPPQVRKELLPRLINLGHEPVRMAVMSGWPADALELRPELWANLVAVCAADYTAPNQAFLRGNQEEAEEEQRRIARQIEACGVDHPVVRLAAQLGAAPTLSSLARRTDWPVAVQCATLQSYGAPLLRHIGQGSEVPVDALRDLFTASRAAAPSSSAGSQPLQPRTGRELGPKDLLSIHRLATKRDGTVEPAIATLAAQALSKLALEVTAGGLAGVPVPEVLYGHYWLPWLDSLDFVVALEREAIVRVLAASPDRDVRLRLTSQLAALTNIDTPPRSSLPPPAPAPTPKPGRTPRTNLPTNSAPPQQPTPSPAAIVNVAGGSASPVAPPSPMTRTPRR